MEASILAGARSPERVDGDYNLPMTNVVQSIEAEYRRYKSLAESAISQLEDAELATARGGGNSVAVLVWHLSGNLASRFTEFLTSDGEKPWRARESEFETRTVTRGELLEKWDAGWSVLLNTLGALGDGDLQKTVTIREQPLTVLEALHRSVCHAAYHVGQIVYLAKSLRGQDWSYLSIPPGGSEAYNKNPSFEKPSDHANVLSRRPDRH